MKDKRYLDFEELEDLEKVIRVGLVETDKLRTNEKGFLADIGEKLNTYGERLQVSDKQWNWLVAIAKKVGVEVE